ncbi:MAG: glycosyltransferase family 4 protein [Planctomycetota bacterium]
MTDSGTPTPSVLLIPGAPVSEYEHVGQGARLAARYNPTGMFAAVHCLAPWEDAPPRQAHGMRIRRAPEFDIPNEVARLSPAVIRAENAEWAADLAVAQRPAGVPVVVYARDPHPGKMRTSLRFADRVVCVSETVRREVLRKGVRPENTSVLYNRIDRDVFQPLAAGAPAVRAVRAQFPFGRVILHVGRRRPEKNIPTVVAALAHLPSDYGAVFVGAGDEAPFVEEARRLGVAERCRWLAPVPNDDLPAWYAACDVFCVPSLWEAFGYIFAEAAACGAAIVTSDIGAMNEYLVHEESALLVQANRDPAALAAAIRRAAEDEDLRARLQANAPRAVQRFDRHLLEREEADLYRDIIARGPRRLTAVERVRYAFWRLCRSRPAWVLTHPWALPGILLRRLGRGGAA